MENTTTSRTVLKYLAILLLPVLPALITAITLRTCTNAPGTQDAPQPARNGKPECQYPGPSVSSLNFFEHYAHSACRQAQTKFRIQNDVTTLIMNSEYYTAWQVGQIAI